MIVRLPDRSFLRGPWLWSLITLSVRIRIQQLVCDPPARSLLSPALPCISEEAFVILFFKT